ncbi:MAG: GNAT family N-acetyltransferase [Planctomycetes bacterium]|nr:GNAT family N-acetyltransferase [Planctomycetota bacterium]
MPIISVVDSWWGRPMAAMLPRLFFNYFGSTSLIAEQDGERIGFLVGFMPPAPSTHAYIHFVGVDPDSRQAGVGRALYEAFFDLARSANRTKVCCVTSPVNQRSIAFHCAMGFDMKPSQTTIDGLPYHPDYDGPGEDRVVFVKPLDPSPVSNGM